MKIVIPTCDAYRHLVRPNVHFLRKAWPKCPYPIQVIGTEGGINVDADVFYVGPDQNFASNLIKFIDEVYQDELILIWLDDYIAQRIYVDLVFRAVDLVSTHRVDSIRLADFYTPEGPEYEADPRFRIIDKEAPYSFSQQACIWKTAVYRRFLEAGESPWQTELEGSTRIRKAHESLAAFLGAAVPIVQYHNAFSKGYERGTIRWMLERWP